MDQQSVELPTELVTRYRAVDREHVGTATLDTPAHLDRLTGLIGREGMRTPIDLAFNEQFATDGTWTRRICACSRPHSPPRPCSLPIARGAAQESWREHPTRHACGSVDLRS